VFYSDFNFERPIPDRVFDIKKYNRVKSIYFAFQSVSKKKISKKFIFGQVRFILPVLNKLFQLLHVKIWSEKIKNWFVMLRIQSLFFPNFHTLFKARFLTPNLIPPVHPFTFPQSSESARSTTSYAHETCCTREKTGKF
jgi:hypothetical protein